MRYLAVVQSQSGVLEHFVNSFSSDACRITRFNEVWAFESPAFNASSSAAEVFPLADALLSDVRRILSLYGGMSSPVTVNYIQCVDENGQPCGISIRSTITIHMMSPTATTELATPVHGQPLGTAILEASLKDTKIKEALTLFQDLENQWADVCDIIEFLGGPDLVERSGLCTRKEARTIKQTANYYRHLGSPNPSLLPPNPPTLPQASLFARRLLRRWIESRL